MATAARLAVALELDLVCAYAVTGLESSEWKAKAIIDFETLGRDEQEEIGVTVVRELHSGLGATLQDSPVHWMLRILVGAPAGALEAYATALGASLLVLGSPKRRLFGSTSARLRTSTLARLLSHRTVPVLVVPPEFTPGKPDTPYLPMP
ncbi:nucleotide-binding universal stress UspA family protein [Paeniglutamicibacter psychrophenolicus]|uniref:Nucleotide-binding universal stress UspA family protein n=1 Tax=Paeniglutamicibacter psychrophenolicus TaxID=257454 RepID=A0ABS4WBL3_9MICC|nr:nucleotide-binding universal stress UspA family protein [Paeniglutamicibacter psychrophenolicus]